MQPVPAPSPEPETFSRSEVQPMSAKRKTFDTALALRATGGKVEAAWAALGRQRALWPPRIPLIFPFVPACDFDEASRALRDALRQWPTVAAQLGAQLTVVPHGKQFAVQVKVETMGDVINALRRACEDAVPGCASVQTVGTLITIGVFGSEPEAQAAAESTGWSGGELTLDSVSLMTRDASCPAFRTKLAVMLGGSGVLHEVDDGLSAHNPEADYHAASLALEPATPQYQRGKDGAVRLSFQLASQPTKATAASSGKMLFVIDQSYSMLDVYMQVKYAVRHMLEHASAAQPDFVLYSTTAKFATAEDVLNSKVTCATSFEAAFGRIKAYIGQQAVGSTVRVVFMTDGADTASNNLSMAKRLFHAYLQSCKRQVVVHTLGFSRGHNRKFLEEVRTMGSSEGVYRYVDTAEGAELASGFADIFDFLDNTSLRSFTIEGCDGQFQANPTRTVDGGLRFDIMVFGAEAAAAQELHGSIIVVMETGERITLAEAEVDAMFQIRTIEEAQITTIEQLNDLQKELTAMQIQKLPKPQRRKVSEARLVAQEKLDAFHKLFAEVGRGLVAGEGLTARLQSLQYEATFAKVRRTREMHRRAGRNAERILGIDARLKALPKVERGLITATAIGQELICSISGDTVAEILEESHDDVMVFALRVSRPEHVIDAPTQVAVKSICVGGYSHESFVATAGFTIKHAGADKAHGGFVVGSGEQDQDADMGLFIAADGQRMNGCLPLWLHPTHWARVEVQIEPLLGYFFTLDPLGFKGDQYIALFGVLGQALALQDAGDWQRSDWSTWLLNDLTSLCRAVMPRALQYLASGNYTGEERGDILEDFVSSPAGRSKERVPSLSVIIGWLAASHGVDTPSLEFTMAFTEELWRRTLGWVYKGSQDVVVELLESLVYGPTNNEASLDSEMGTNACILKNDPAKEKEFAEYAHYRWGSLGKKRSATLRKRYSTTGVPQAEGLARDDTVASAASVSSTVVAYSDHAEFLDTVVDKQIAKVAKHCGSIAKLWGGLLLGTGFDGATRRLMMIQSLQYLISSHFNTALGNGAVANTIDVVRAIPGGASGVEAVQTIAAVMLERHSHHQEEQLAAVLRTRNSLATAKQIAFSTDSTAVAGRLMAACPTRGGAVFESLIGLLARGECDGQQIPMLRKKIRAVLTGKMRINAEDDRMNVIANGESWVHCPTATVERFAAVLGEEEFTKIEVSMYGHVGHVYRESDIPNRHGYHNSYPNPALAVSFKGFSRGIVAAPNLRSL